jgi:hypothetical protein
MNPMSNDPYQRCHRSPRKSLEGPTLEEARRLRDGRDMTPAQLARLCSACNRFRELDTQGFCESCRKRPDLRPCACGCGLLTACLGGVYWRCLDGMETAA